MKTIEDSYPLSPMQQGMLFHSLYAPRSGVDIEQIICTLYEDLNVSAFKQAWQRVTERQPVLRTGFRWEEVKEPLQEVYQHVNLLWEEQDWRNLSAKQQEKQLESYLQAERRRGFVLTQAPLMRLALFHLAEANYQFIWTFHHGLLDGRSFPFVLQELFAFYEAQGQELQLEQPRPYRDYIDWLGKQPVTKAESFWRQMLNGFTTPTPLVVDHADHIKSNGEEGYETQGIRLSRPLTSALQSLAQQHQLTLNTLLQGAWALLLSRYSGEEDVIFGATRACRRSALKGAESIVGVLINTLPVRARVSPETLLLPWLKELRAQWQAIRDYEHTPLVKVQSWSDIPPGKPLFESILIFENYRLNSALRSLGGRWQKREFRLLEQTNYPLTMAGYAEPELLLEITYKRQRFNNTTIARMLGHIRTLLESMVANLNQPLSELPILTQIERHQLLVEWNNTQVDYPKDTCIHQLFEAQVEKTPDAVAVVFDNEQLTYWDMNCRANQLAHYLQKIGVGPDVLVGICVERSLDLGVVILGTLKAGGACVVLDPTEPDESLTFFLEDAQLSILLTQERLLDEKPFLQELPKHKRSIICVDQIREQLVQESSQTPPSRVTAENLAYITYTSGSTGKPKGVMTSHRALCSRQLSWQSTFQLTAADRLLLNVYRSLILHYLLIGPLLLGGQVIMARPDGHRDSAYLTKLIAQEKITGICVVPSMLRVLLQEESFATCSSLRKVFCGSEALPIELQEDFFANLSADLYNIYGLTETTFATIWKCQRFSRQEFVPIGRPTANTKVYILDSYLQPVPVGVSGELYIGGDGLARGYLNRPELTAERFMPNPFDQPGAHLYKTGDLACYQADGSIKYLGRIDRQVKIRGFRIELAEIETVLRQHPAVQQTAILAREDIPGDKRLVTYVVPTDQVPTFNQLRSFLAEKLPSYMVPSYFTFLETLPRTASGQLNYNALPLPSRARPEIEETFVAPRNPVETVLADIWAKVLNVEQVGLYDNFFVLGGNSLLGVQIVSSVRRVFHVQLPLKSLFETPTLIEMSQAIISHQAKPGLAEKIARVVQRVKNMPVKEMREMLQKKKGNR